MLQAFTVEILVDVRSIPYSRHNPQFCQGALEDFLLRGNAVKYRYMKNLGGLRHTKKDSTNLGWHNTSFRGYADYMETEDFSLALAELIALGRESRVAIMCAESVPWRCHRSLIGDALLAREIAVMNIMSDRKASPHRMTKFACVDGDRISYPKVETDDVSAQ